MNIQKSAAKWLAIILLVSISIFSYAMYDSFFISNGGQVQGESPNSDDNNLNPTLPPNTPTDDNKPPVVPEVVYSVLPRNAITLDSTTIQHTGGKSEEVLLASHSLGDLTFAILKTASNSFDYKAENHIALALFDNNVLKSTLVFSEKNETYLDSKLTSAGLIIISKTSDNQCKIRQYTENLLQKGQEDIDFSETVFQAKLYADKSELLLFALTDSQLFCKSITSALVETDKCSPIDISSANIVSIQKINNIFVLCLNNILNGINTVSLATYSELNGFQISKTFSMQTALSLNIVSENNVPYFLLATKSAPDINIFKIDVLFQTVYYCAISNASTVIISIYGNGYIAITENAICYLCHHLDILYQQNLNDIGLENEYDCIKSLLLFNNSIYFLIYSTSTHNACLLKLESFSISSLFTFGAENSTINLFVSTTSLKIVFTTALRDGIFADNFGGKDVYFVQIETNQDNT